jgi:hypothetical protein
MPIRTLADVQSDLAAVNAAITRTLEAQSYGIGSRNKQNAQLATLRSMKSDLLVEQERMSNTAGEGGSYRNPVFNTRGS